MNVDSLDRILGPRISRWSAMRHEGDSIEACMEISRYFALSIDGISLEDIYAELLGFKQTGATPTYLQVLIDRIMVSSIRYEWGEEVSNMIRQCIFK